VRCPIVKLPAILSWERRNRLNQIFVKKLQLKGGNQHMSNLVKCQKCYEKYKEDN